MLKFPINQAGQLLSKAALGIQAMHRISHFMERESNDTENKNLGSSDDNTVLKVEKGIAGIFSQSNKLREEGPDTKDKL